MSSRNGQRLSPFDEGGPDRDLQAVTGRFDAQALADLLADLAVVPGVGLHLFGNDDFPPAHREVLGKPRPAARPLLVPGRFTLVVRLLFSRRCVPVATGDLGLFCRVGIQQEFELGGIELLALGPVNDPDQVIHPFTQDFDLGIALRQQSERVVV